MAKEKQYEIPSLNVCKKYIAEAEKIDNLPDDEVDIITFDFDEETLNGLQIIAESWGISVERVMQTMLIALVRENEV
jgi:hypothetical protein